MLMKRKKTENSRKKIVHTSTVEAATQLNKYNEDDGIGLDEDPLAYWKNYPCVELKEIALQTLSIPATSTPSERIFSRGGNFVTKRRNRLSPRNVNRLVYLNKNHKIFK